MRRVLLLAGVLLAVVAPSAGAKVIYREYLSGPDARAMVRADGGSSLSCWRITAKHIRCNAVYRVTRVEEEEDPVDSGQWVVVSKETNPVIRTVDVGLKGVRCSANC